MVVNPCVVWFLPAYLPHLLLFNVLHTLTYWIVSGLECRTISMTSWLLHGVEPTSICELHLSI